MATLSTQDARRIADDLDRGLAGTPMAGLGDRFVAAAQRNGLDPYLLPAIASVESGFGRTGFATNGSHNAFGMGVTGAPNAGYRYRSWGEGIDAAADNLGGSLYKGDGRLTIARIGEIWAASPNWPSAVASKFPGGVSVDKKVIGNEVTYGPGGIPQQGGGIPEEMQPGNNIFDSFEGPVGKVLAFIKDYVIKILAFVLIGVVAVWLLGQGASKAFGTPAPSAVLGAGLKATPIGRAAA